MRSLSHLTLASLACPLENNFPVHEAYSEVLLRSARKKRSINSNHIPKPSISMSLSHFLLYTKTPQAEYHDLYWAMGDGGPQEDPNDHGQRTDVLFGTVVRISVPSKGSGYEVPSDNFPDAGKL